MTRFTFRAQMLVAAFVVALVPVAAFAGDLIGSPGQSEVSVSAKAAGPTIVVTAVPIDSGVLFRITTASQTSETTVTGGIFAKYDSLGNAQGLLGLPTGDAYVYDTIRNADGQNFEGGAIYYSPLAKGYVVEYFNQ